VFGAERKEVTGGRAHLYDAEIQDEKFYPNIIQMVSLRRVSYRGDLEIMGYKYLYTRL